MGTVRGGDAAETGGAVVVGVGSGVAISGVVGVGKSGARVDFIKLICSAVGGGTGLGPSVIFDGVGVGQVPGARSRRRRCAGVGQVPDEVEGCCAGVGQVPDEVEGCCVGVGQMPGDDDDSEATGSIMKLLTSDNKFISSSSDSEEDLCLLLPFSLFHFRLLFCEALVSAEIGSFAGGRIGESEGGAIRISETVLFLAVVVVCFGVACGDDFEEVDVGGDGAIDDVADVDDDEDGEAAFVGDFSPMIVGFVTVTVEVVVVLAVTGVAVDTAVVFAGDDAFAFSGVEMGGAADVSGDSVVATGGVVIDVADDFVVVGGVVVVGREVDAVVVVFVVVAIFLLDRVLRSFVGLENTRFFLLHLVFCS